MSWFSLAIISVLSISVANIYQRMVMREEGSNPLVSSIAFQFILACIIGIYAVFRGFVLPPVIQLWPYFLVSAVFYAGGTLALFSAIKKIGASEVTILSAAGAIVTILLAVVFLHERFTLFQGIGTLLILLSVYLVQGKTNFSEKSGVLYALIGTVMYSVGVVSDTVVLRTYDAVSYSVVMSFLPGLVLLVTKPSIIFVFRKTVKRQFMKHMLLYCIFYAIQAVSYYMALAAGAGASQMSPITRAQTILTVILAGIFLRETDNMSIKVLSALFVTVGVLLLR